MRSAHEHTATRPRWVRENGERRPKQPQPVPGQQQSQAGSQTQALRVTAPPGDIWQSWRHGWLSQLQEEWPRAWRPGLLLRILQGPAQPLTRAKDPAPKRKQPPAEAP